MIREILFGSITGWAARLAGVAPARYSRASKRSSKRAARFRPQLQTLEDRCLLSTITYTITDSDSSDKDTTAKPPSAVVQTVTSIGKNQEFGQRITIAILEADSQSTQITSLTASWSVSTLSANAPTNVMAASTRWVISGQASQFAGFNITITLPVAPSTQPATSLQITLSIDISRSNTWRSQTPHPSAEPTVLLTTAYGGLSSVPPAQASTPVISFLPGSSIGYGNEVPASPVVTMLISALAKELVALKIIGISGAPKDADHGEGPLSEIEGTRGKLLEPAEIQKPGSLESFKPTKSRLRPTRTELHALTDKILAEATHAEEPEPETRIGFSLTAILACAAAESTWLMLRYFATSRVPLPADDEEERRVGVWKKPK